MKPGAFAAGYCALGFASPDGGVRGELCVVRRIAAPTRHPRWWRSGCARRSLAGASCTGGADRDRYAIAKVRAAAIQPRTSSGQQKLALPLPSFRLRLR